MKHTILYTLRRLCAPALMLGAMLAATSCTDELSSEVVPGEGGSVAGESEVTLRLQVPAASGGSQTRAVDAATESTVNDLYILAFKAGRDAETFDYYVTASKTAIATEWMANLRVRAEQQTFVMVANAQGTPGKVNEQIAALAAGSVGHKKDDVLAKLTDALTAAEQTAGFNAATPTDHHPFTMYGQTAPTVITANAGLRLEVRMHRIVARVQIGFTGDAAGTKFTPQEVSLYNYNDRARVIPDNLTETVADGYETDPTIPAGAVRLPATVDGTQTVPTYAVNANQISHQIYLFETAQPVGGTAQEQHVTRPCLIVKGVYENAAKPCYYRIDFFGEKTAGSGVKEYMDIVRNHSYNVTVQNVLAPGHDTPEEALTAKAANITATVVKWNDSDIGDIDFDGEHVLGIATMKYQLGRKGSNTGTLLQQVKASKGLKWKANLYVMDDHGKVDTNTTPDWISFAGGAKEATGTGNMQFEDLEFTASRIPGNIVERRAVMRFTARNLMVEALVVQDQSSPVYIIVRDKNGREITEQEFDDAGEWCDEMIIEFGPENTELSWKANGVGGMTLLQTKVDGAAATTAMGGTKNSGGEEECQMPWTVQAAALAETPDDYATRTGTLILIAKGKGGVVSKSIRLFQNKYGVTLNENMLVCTGDPEKLLVKGNMNWEVEPVLSTDVEEPDTGYEEVLKNNYIEPYEGPQTGVEFEEYFYEDNSVTFKTQKPDPKQPAIDIKLRFTDKGRNKSVVKTVKMQPGIEMENAIYAMIGPVKLSPKEYDTRGGFRPDTIPESYQMISRSQAQFLMDNGYGDPLGHNDTKCIFEYEFSGFGNTTWHGLTAGEKETRYYERLNYTTWAQVGFRRVFRMSDVVSQNKKEIYVQTSHSWSIGYSNEYGSNIGFIVPSSTVVKAIGATKTYNYYPYLYIDWYYGGNWSQIYGWTGGVPVNQLSNSGTWWDWNREGWASYHLPDARATKGKYPYSMMHEFDHWWKPYNSSYKAWVSPSRTYINWDDKDKRTEPRYNTYFVKKIKDLQ